MFAALSETLHNQVRIVAAEKNDMAEEAQRIITTIKQIETSLNDSEGRHQYEIEDEDLKITYPLSRCLQKLKEKHSQVNKIHRERFAQVKSKFSDCNHRTDLLTSLRACTSPRILFVPPRVFVH